MNHLLLVNFNAKHLFHQTAFLFFQVFTQPPCVLNLESDLIVNPNQVYADLISMVPLAQIQSIPSLSWSFMTFDGLFYQLIQSFGNKGQAMTVFAKMNYFSEFLENFDRHLLSVLNLNFPSNDVNQSTY